jgi:hypothetical protein
MKEHFKKELRLDKSWCRQVAAMFLPAILASCGIAPMAYTLVKDAVETPAELDEKCSRQELTNQQNSTVRWTKDCWDWKRKRDDAAEAESVEKRRIDEAAKKVAREQELVLYRKQQEQKQQEAQEREIVSMRADERNGYKNLTFGDFNLDASTLQGARIAIRGVYVGKGERLAYDYFDAAMWVSNSKNNKKPLIPLDTKSATREARALLMQCSESRLGCTVVVRGRIRQLTLQNSFGVVRQEFGVVVESVR